MNKFFPKILNGLIFFIISLQAIIYYQNIKPSSKVYSQKSMSVENFSNSSKTLFLKLSLTPSNLGLSIADVLAFFLADIFPTQSTEPLPTRNTETLELWGRIRRLKKKGIPVSILYLQMLLKATSVHCGGSLRNMGYSFSVVAFGHDHLFWKVPLCAFVK